MANNKKQELEIKVNEDKLEGNYSNLMKVSHTEEEFILDFFLASPPKGVLNSRVIMSPGHVKRLIKALQENVKKYEQQFGEVEEAQGTDVSDQEVGFDPES